MSCFRIGIVILSMLTYGNARAGEYISSCAAALKDDELNYQSNDAVKIAYLETIISKNLTDEKFFSDGSAAYGIIGANGSVDAARKRKNELEKATGIRFSKEAAVGLVSSSLSARGASAFTDCVNAAFSKTGIYLEVLSTDASATEFRVRATSSPGNSRPYRISAISNGTLLGQLSTRFAASGGAQSFFIKRSNPARPLRVVVYLYNDDGDPIDSASISVPPLVVVTSTEKRRWKTSEVVMVSCGGNRDAATRLGKTATVEASDGAHFDATTIALETVEVGGDKGRFPSSGSGLTNVSASDVLITAVARCVPSSKDEVSWGKYQIRVSEISYDVKRDEPKDNGVEPETIAMQ